MGKRHFYQSKHPFGKCPFEVLYCGSWKPVELIRIRNGSVSMHLEDIQCASNEIFRSFSSLRIKSRLASLSDCTCILRPGIDICVLSASQLIKSLDEEDPEPVWIDAKIKDIERKPHDFQCTCQFHINLYINSGSEKLILSKETEVVGIDRISILQTLEKWPSEDQHYRWSSSKDCFMLKHSRVFLGKFSADVSWLLAASIIKETAFDVRSVQNKIVYQIMDKHSIPLKSDNLLSAVNFRVENGTPESHVVLFKPSDTHEADTACAAQEAGDFPSGDVMNLRRSKRRKLEPERYLACDIIPETDPNWFRKSACKINNWREEEEDEMFLPLSYLFGMDASSSEEDVQDKTGDCIAYKDNNSTSRKVKSCGTNAKARQNKLGALPLPSKTSHQTAKQNHLPRIPRKLSEEVDLVSFKYCDMKGSWLKQQRKVPAVSDFMDFDFMSKGKGKPSSKRSSNKGQNQSSHSMYSRREGVEEQITYRGKRTLSAGAYNKLIKSYMKKIDFTTTKEEPNVVDQWEEFQKTKDSGKSREMEQSEEEDEEEVYEEDILWKELEISKASSYLEENEARVAARVSSESLQKASGGCQHEYKLDEEIGIRCRFCGYVKTEIAHVSAPFMEKKYWSPGRKQFHEEGSEQKLDEDEEGLDTSFNFDSPNAPLSEESQNVWALIPELKKKLHLHQKKAFEFLWNNIAGSLVPSEMESAAKNTGGCVISHSPGAGKTFLIIAFLVSYLKLYPGKRPLVLAPKTTLYTWYKEFIKWEIPVPVHLIHGRRSYRVFKEKYATFSGIPRPSQDVMHVLDCLEKIQKWHLQPSILVMGYTSFLTLMREDSKFEHRRFMAKVLRESPGLLVLDEGHNPRSTKSRLRKGLMKVETKLRILLSGTLFQNNFCEYFNTLLLARPKFLGEVLNALDPKFKKKNNVVEKATRLSKKKNNGVEKAPNMSKKKNNGVEKVPHMSEYRARKFFLDHIAKKIDSDNGEERMQGLNMLRNLTSGFIDVYEGAGSDSLPGLQIYTLMMNPTEIQNEILVKLHDIMAGYSGYPLELELLITLASIHPWLVKTSNCVNKFFSEAELAELEMLKFECKKGSKVMFVLNLVCRVFREEKVLLFCHNIAPINLFLDLFQKVFRWQKGREILVLTGDLELFERGKVMDKFEEPGGPSRVLLASITACAEGISLTAASRVILLDSEWNPSKTKQAIARAFRPGQQKVVYVYQLLARATLEEDKYRRTTWKEWVSSMIFSEAFVEDPSSWQAEKIEDDLLREMVAEDKDKVKSFHMIMKNEKASTG